MLITASVVLGLTFGFPNALAAQLPIFAVPAIIGVFPSFVQHRLETTL